MIREALHNELGYAVTDKYKQFTHHLMMAYKEGKDIKNFELNSLSIREGLERKAF